VFAKSLTKSKITTITKRSVKNYYFPLLALYSSPFDNSMPTKQRYPTTVG